MSKHTDKVLKEMGQSPGFAEHVDRTLGWHLEHKRLGFADPIADVYEALLSEKAQLSEEDATFNAKNVELNATQDVQSVGCVGDYISRQAAIEALGERPMIWTDSDYEIAQRNQYDCDKLAIETVPAADVVEVVRCKDCRWWDKYGEYDNGYCMAAKHGFFSEHWEIRIRRTYKGDFYCADAEPKEEQEDG